MKDHADEIKIATTQPLRTGSEEEEKITARWGDVFVEQSTIIMCDMGNDQSLHITIKTGEQVVLGRIRATTTAMIMVEDLETIPVMEEGFRKQLIELALLEKEERERIEAIQASKNPTINLEAYQAGSLGVSRQHAVLEMGDKFITITDLNSTNGTRLNGMKLAPYHRRLLRAGDELALGNLFMKISYKMPTDDEPSQD